MFNILAMCDDYILGNILNIVKKTIDILGIVVPILLIIGGSINIAKGVFNPEDKKAVKKVVNQFVSAVIIFLLPFVINTTMKILSVANDDTTSVGIHDTGKVERFDLATCWNNIRTTKIDYTASFDSSVKKTSDAIQKELENNKYEQIIQNYWKKKEEKEKQKQQNNNNSNNNNSSSNVQAQTFNKIVLIGDSRFAGSDQWYKIGNEKTVYIAKGGTGLQYIKDQMTNIKKYDNENAAFVINSGINDRGIVNSYISYLNEQAKTFKGKVYYLSVNPVEESKQQGSPYYTTNQQVNTFNDKMKSGLDSKYITYLDSNSYLKSKGYNTSDGIHYDKETSQKIFDFITQYVK